MSTRVCTFEIVNGSKKYDLKYEVSWDCDDTDHAYDIEHKNDEGDWISPGDDDTNIKVYREHSGYKGYLLIKFYIRESGNSKSVTSELNRKIHLNLDGDDGQFQVYFKEGESFDAIVCIDKKAYQMTTPDKPMHDIESIEIKIYDVDKFIEYDTTSICESDPEFHMDKSKLTLGGTKSKYPVLGIANLEPAYSWDYYTGFMGSITPFNEDGQQSGNGLWGHVSFETGGSSITYDSNMSNTWTNTVKAYGLGLDTKLAISSGAGDSKADFSVSSAMEVDTQMQSQLARTTSKGGLDFSAYIVCKNIQGNLSLEHNPNEMHGYLSIDAIPLMNTIRNTDSTGKTLTYSMPERQEALRKFYENYGHGCVSNIHYFGSGEVHTNFHFDDSNNAFSLMAGLSYGSNTSEKNPEASGSISAGFSLSSKMINESANSNSNCTAHVWAEPGTFNWFGSLMGYANSVQDMAFSTYTVNGISELDSAMGRSQTDPRPVPNPGSATSIEAGTLGAAEWEYAVDIMYYSAGAYTATLWQAIWPEIKEVEDFVPSTELEKVKEDWYNITFSLLDSSSSIRQMLSNHNDLVRFPVTALNDILTLLTNYDNSLTNYTKECFANPKAKTLEFWQTELSNVRLKDLQTYIGANAGDYNDLGGIDLSILEYMIHPLSGYALSYQIDVDNYYYVGNTKHDFDPFCDINNRPEEFFGGLWVKYNNANECPLRFVPIVDFEASVEANKVIGQYKVFFTNALTGGGKDAPYTISLSDVNDLGMIGDDTINPLFATVMSRDIETDPTKLLTLRCGFQSIGVMKGDDIDDKDAVNYSVGLGSFKKVKNSTLEDQEAKYFDIVKYLPFDVASTEGYLNSYNVNGASGIMNNTFANTTMNIGYQDFACLFSPMYTSATYNNVYKHVDEFSGSYIMEPTTALPNNSTPVQGWRRGVAPIKIIKNS